jgi:hypothetical protein
LVQRDFEGESTGGIGYRKSRVSQKYVSNDYIEASTRRRGCAHGRGLGNPGTRDRGRVDLNGGSAASFRRNVPSRRLTGRRIFGGPDQNARAADFDGDGYADLVLQNTIFGGRVIWRLSNGAYYSSISLPTVSTVWNIVDH